MSSQTSWRPDVPELQLFNENTWLQGATLATLAYGVNLALFILIISLFITRLKVDIKQNGRVSRQTACLTTYVCAMFILSTLAVASQAEMTRLSFIENRDFPGGPAAYQETMFSIPISNLGNCCNCIMNWFSDSLLLWRCFVVYGSSKTSRIWLVMAIPGLMLLASFVTGTIFLERISQASSSPWANSAFASNVIYSTVTISLNIVLTFMIVIRLYIHRRRLTKFVGRHHASHYTSIIAMLIESASILVVMGLWFLIPFLRGNQLANIPLLSMIQVQTAASYMIIFRVAQGTAWTSQTADYSESTIHDVPEHVGNLSNIRFQPGPIKHPADSWRASVTSQSRNQFPLDGRDVLVIGPNSRSTIYESSHTRDPARVIEKAEPVAF